MFGDIEGSRFFNTELCFQRAEIGSNRNYRKASSERDPFLTDSQRSEVVDDSFSPFSQR